MNKPIPYNSYLLIEPVEAKTTLISDAGSLQTYGVVIATGKDVKDTLEGDYVAFELWDLKDVVYEEKKLFFVREEEAICKLPSEWFNGGQTVQEEPVQG